MTMTHPQQLSPRFAVCINNTDYPASLERHKIYQVIPDEISEADGDLRIIDESGEDYLYPASYFVMIDVPYVLEASLIAGSMSI
jgi:hypothetical protein